MLTDAERACRELGPGNRSSQLWTAAVEFNDSLSRFHREFSRVRGELKARNRAGAGMA